MYKKRWAGMCPAGAKKLSRYLRTPPAATRKIGMGGRAWETVWINWTICLGRSRHCIAPRTLLTDLELSSAGRKYGKSWRSYASAEQRNERCLEWRQPA